MQLINATRMPVGCAMGMEPSGRELLVVVIKGTFFLPRPGEQVRLHDEQVPLVMADTFSGEPGFSAPVREVDYAPYKPACDVLLVGSAYAPGEREVTRTQVGLRVGPLSKSCSVFGDRVWEAGVTGIHVGAPTPFWRLPVSYDVAFGGADRESDDPSEHDVYAPNPVGRGYRKHLKSAWVDGRPLPSTEEPGQPVDWPTGKYKPMAFGPVGRSWPQRACHAGTYDQEWLDDTYPFLPRDFDDRYYQAAPLDQQIPHPTSALHVTLSNFTADGLRQFTLPHFEAPVHVFPKRGEREKHAGVLDTIVFEPDLERFTMTWRVTRPLRKSMHEIGQILVGRKGTEWWQQRDKGAFPIPVVMVPTGHIEAAIE